MIPTHNFKTCTCGGQLRCMDSRSSQAGGLPHIRRRYRCVVCGERITTAELVMPERQGRNKSVLDRFMERMEFSQVTELKNRIRELL